MMGENPFLSDPNINKVRKALSALEFLVVQDIFLTETAEFADVVLPATSYIEKDGTYTNTDRRVQIGRKVLEPPGEAREDWKIIRDISNRVGLPMDYDSPSEIFDELASRCRTTPGSRTTTSARAASSTRTPTPSTPTARSCCSTSASAPTTGKAHLVPAEWLPAKELPDDEFPFILNTGRLLEHWHTGSMTRRSFALDAIQPEAHVYLNPDDARDGRRRRRLRARQVAARVDRAARAAVAPRHAGHLLHPVPLPRGGGEPADDRRDRPDGKIPEFKFCAVKIAWRRRGRARAGHRARGA